MTMASRTASRTQGNRHRCAFLRHEVDRCLDDAIIGNVENTEGHDCCIPMSGWIKGDSHALAGEAVDLLTPDAFLSSVVTVGKA